MSENLSRPVGRARRALALTQVQGKISLSFGVDFGGRLLGTAGSTHRCLGSTLACPNICSGANEMHILRSTASRALLAFSGP